MENTKEQVVAEWKAVNEPRLKEIKSANPELYSAINLALNYLNKKLTGEELPAEVEEVKEVEVIETKPIEESAWRFKTKDEIIAEYGKVEYFGVPQIEFLEFYGKPLSELYTKTRFNNLDEAIGALKTTGLKISESGWTVPVEYFTQKPLPSNQSIAINQSGITPSEGLFSLAIETYPEKLKFAKPWFSRNTGDRKGPTQSASELKKRSYSEDEINEILTTKFKGNDGNWYDINVGKGGVWTWKKTDPPQIQQQTISTNVSSQPVTIAETKKEWVPEDLVGKKLLFLNSNNEYKVLVFTRNNPKNKEYLLENLKSGENIKYRISFSLVKKWLDGMRASGVEIIKD